MRVVGTRRGVHQCHRFADEAFVADQPIQRILHRTGDAMGVLGARDQQSVGTLYRVTQLTDGFRQIGLAIGVEQREITQSPVDHDLQIGRRQLGGSATERGIDRCRAETSGDRQDVHESMRSVIWGEAGDPLYRAATSAAVCGRDPRGGANPQPGRSAPSGTRQARHGRNRVGALESPLFPGRRYGEHVTTSAVTYWRRKAGVTAEQLYSSAIYNAYRNGARLPKVLMSAFGITKNTAIKYLCLVDARLVDEVESEARAA